MIEKGIPIPDFKPRPYHADFPFAKLAREMEIGDSIWFKDHTDANSLRSCLYKLDFSASARPAVKNGIEGYRIWKLRKK